MLLRNYAIKLFLPVFILGLSLASFSQNTTDSLFNLLNSSGTSAQERVNYLNSLSNIYLRDSTSQAMIYANEAYILSLQQKNKLGEARSLLNLAEGYLYNDNYDQALQYAFNALDISKTEKSNPDIASCYTLLGWIFYDTENAEFAMQYHRLAAELLEQTGDRKKFGVSCNAIGLVHYVKQQYDSALFYFQKALTIARQEKNSSGEAAALNNIGICKSSLSRYQEAIDYFNQALAIKEFSRQFLMQAETLNQLADSYIRLKNYPEAEKLLVSARALIDSSSSNSRKEKLLDNLYIFSLLYQAQGRYTEAFLRLQEHNAVREQILSSSKSNAIAAMKLKRETQEKEEQIKILAAQKELRSFQRNALAVGLLLLIIIGLLLFNRIKHKRQKEKELAEMKQALIKQELDNTVLEKEALANKLNYKNAELKNSALYISQRNELIREFVKELEGWQSEMQKDNQGRFLRLLNKFQYSLDLNKEAQELNQAIEETNKDFFYNLLQQFPDLTENEKRLCAQIRLNLSIKDIASLNNISIKSAEMARYRLRKHFGLNHEDNLNEFLRKF